VKTKLTRGHSVSFRVNAVGRPLIDAIEEALTTLREAGVPIDAEWQMAFHQGKQVNKPEPFVEADYISIDATWAEQS
jgi:hypothetical protein